VLCLWRERSQCQPMAQSTRPLSSDRCVYPCTYPWSQPYSCCCQEELCSWRVNHIAVEEAQEAPDVVIGMFLINDTSAVMLFDSRASHYFISATYVEKHNLPLSLLNCQMIVSSLGGDMPARQLCPKVNLKIRGGTLCRQHYSFGIQGH
jgi:hypothetical protein